ncbi:hypothetical protein Bcop_1860 [Bacteroides coprosuis DSM 18011]|uniref:Spore protein YkvP/CgeB glycosyl transferase-like domain-containing protein n=1 Tax=Bacteroides coprosuis DSM 18011 TaxID=679937 RepID=F3ZS27_9BACE|nr:glycosyltransferase [Bacteroides coprosuis]EGJ72048.1 hypothetical protein Bcop_1860 [Bacteroides coprosuis DSM 18011]
MRILILVDEVWNDYVFGNGVLTNWFTGFNAEYATVYLSPGLPNNKICNRYFQVTDKDMFISLVGKRAGRITNNDSSCSEMVAQHQGIYHYLKKISIIIHTPMMMLRDAIWCMGRYNEEALKSFIDDFKPDIVFSPRKVSPKFLRLEKIIYRLCGKPIVPFTGDNEIGYDCFSLSPFFWIRRYFITKMFEKNVAIYSHYFAHSKRQTLLYSQKYKLSTSVLFKCSSYISNHNKSSIDMPIKVVYAGRLYCNRWKTLAAIGKAIKKINQEGEKIRLYIYTMDKLTKKQRKVLSEENSVYVKGGVTPDQLVKIYNHADIALHVESFDRVNMLATKYSFSTKIIDLLSSGCAVMAICWEKQTGYEYLSEQDAGICIPSYDRIEPKLRELLANPQIILEYTQKAMDCAKKNHSRKAVHKQLSEIFKNIINNY